MSDKRRTKKRILILLALLVCICASALAEEDTAALYDQGTEALKAGDYKTAAVYFEKAVRYAGGFVGNKRNLGRFFYRSAGFSANQ